MKSSRFDQQERVFSQWEIPAHSGDLRIFGWLQMYHDVSLYANAAYRNIYCIYCYIYYVLCIYIYTVLYCIYILILYWLDLTGIAISQNMLGWPPDRSTRRVDPAAPATTATRCRWGGMASSEQRVGVCADIVVLRGTHRHNYYL